MRIFASSAYFDTIDSRAVDGTGNEENYSFKDGTGFGYGYGFGISSGNGYADGINSNMGYVKHCDSLIQYWKLII